ncbi:MAG: MFS transporter, partial [Candidatus Micrarchaeota archaeon]
MLETITDFVSTQARALRDLRALRSASRLPRRIRESDFAAAAFVRFAYWVFGGWMWIFFPLYALSQGFSLVQAGVVATALVLPRILTNGSFGVLTDLKSPKRVALASTALAAVGFAALSLSVEWRLSFEALLALVIALGFATSVAEVSTTSLAYKRVSPSCRGRHVGILEFSKASAIGVSLLLAGTIFSFAGYATGFALCAACMALVFVVCLVVARDFRGAVAERTYWSSFTSKEIALLLAVMLFVSFHFGVENATMSVYSRNALGLDDSGVGRLFALTIFAYGVFNYFSGKRLDTPGRRKSIFVAGLALSAFGFAAFGFTTNFWVAVAFRAIHELGDAIVIVYALYSFSRIGGAKRIGGLQGVYVTLTTVGSAVGSFAAGVIASSIGGNAGLTAS